MTQLLSLLLLAFAVSLDSYSVGFTYGVRKMFLPFRSIVIIACCSAITLLFAMGIGGIIVQFLSPSIAEKIGGIILIGIGAWVLYQVFRPERSEKNVSVKETIIKFEIRSLGIVIQILRKPTAADFDKSGTITGIEAVLLGVALSLDAFAAGIGAVLIGYSPWIMAISVAVMSSLFVTFGMKCGHFFSNFKWMDKFSFLPGLILIILGIWKF
ncbi:sporulation membrane protein YtaF [Lottiidibacillus patelloidae]|uniref:Sporulation membrane protein YtaF n=1 Tax=Lottiidibacillus patelloidae TaxID=2670334 RepID=A0A263BW22_9BACI|nr:sporulation membrane protein YtaF [Lottiidibacillus patelloidae]OZM57943.1 sporulation membrane protein YtaF [Lottiidibacillus patelloidae]